MHVRDGDRDLSSTGRDRPLQRGAVKCDVSGPFGSFPNAAFRMYGAVRFASS